MKLPINLVARFLLKRVVVPAVGKAVANGKSARTASRTLWRKQSRTKRTVSL